MSAVAALGLGTILAWLNPDQDAFDAYATSQLAHYLEEDVCEQIASPLKPFMEFSCKDLLLANQGSLQKAVRDRTRRYDFVLFSIYRTHLELPTLGILPAYQIDTLGILGQFYTLNMRQT